MILQLGRWLAGLLSATTSLSLCAAIPSHEVTSSWRCMSAAMHVVLVKILNKTEYIIEKNEKTNSSEFNKIGKN